MISLDTRLEGDVLRLRDSMIKFKIDPMEKVSDIEICGAGLKPLPMFLNRPLIKILEDLGVPESAFLHLQEVAVDQLRMTTESPVNAANFLQRNYIGKAARLPWLVRKLLDINILFNDDDFLRNVLELAILMQLRELKHRTSSLTFSLVEESLESGCMSIFVTNSFLTGIIGSRILVENGMTLYGNIPLRSTIRGHADNARHHGRNGNPGRGPNILHGVQRGKGDADSHRKCCCH